MAKNWVAFNEYEDVIVSTDLLALLATNISKRPSYWKWIVLAVHNGAQGALVCSVQDTSATNILSEPSAKKMLKWLETLSGEPPTKFLANFSTLLEKYQQKYPDNGMTAEQIENVGKLNDLFRNNFAHFVPKGWRIEIALMRTAVESALDLIEVAISQPQVLMHLSAI